MTRFAKLAMAAGATLTGLALLAWLMRPRTLPPPVDVSPPKVPARKREGAAPPIWVPAPNIETPHDTAEPIWLAFARREIGTKEGVGADDSPRVLAYYAAAGHPEIKHDTVPWCAAFVSACLEKCAIPSAKSLWARSYLNWGRPVDTPEIGAIVVLQRGNDATTGHVGFVCGSDATRVQVLGGNQADAVSIRWFPKSRILGYRMPTTITNSRTIVTAASGAAAASVLGFAEIAPQITEIGSEFKAIEHLSPWFGLIGSLITIAVAAAMVYFRVHDLHTKGR